ncbi:MAG TPA: AlpA family phage regulatory protein [Rubrivivax sp.]|nr:AlpA family phage regulatory protein [Rubrivivax sp.]
MSEVIRDAASPATKPRKRPQQPLHAAQVADALLRLATVEALTGLGRSTIYAKLKAREFVEPVRLGARCTRWRAGDVQVWLAAQGR